MLAYNYQINFSSLRKWLPQTTQKIIYYLQKLNDSESREQALFDINKTKWHLCVKAKNSKGAAELEKIAQKACHKEEPNLDDFKQFLELSHIVEIYVKAFFEKIVYRSKSINYLSYKNQHIFLSKKNTISHCPTDRLLSAASDSPYASEPLALEIDNIDKKKIKVDFGEKTLSYTHPLSNSTVEISGLKTFTFEGLSDCVFAIGFHSEADREANTYTLYEIDIKAKTIRVKYYLDKKTAQLINSINDLAYHEVHHKKLKLYNMSMDNLKFIF